MGTAVMETVTTLPVDTALSDVPAVVRRIERVGFDTVHVPETTHDSLAVALLAAEHTTSLTVRTSMTLAFPRSPMVTAYAAWDLARFSGGRFQLGLATQVRGNIVGRFSVPWSDPAGRLADYLRSLRAIFTAFSDGTGLRHHGEHYRFERLQPYFNPGPIDVPAPQLWTGGVNRRVCRVAGALADGFVSHATNSHPEFLRRQLLPALTAGADDARRADIGPRVVVVPRCITGPDDASVATARESVRRELAFLYSTPAYRPTLELVGRADAGERLTAMVRAGNWQDMARVLDDDLLDALVPAGSYADLADALGTWYGGLCHGLNVPLPTDPTADDALAAMLHRIRQIPTAGTSPRSATR